MVTAFVPDSTGRTALWHTDTQYLGQVVPAPQRMVRARRSRLIKSSRYRLLTPWLLGAITIAAPRALGIIRGPSPFLEFALWVASLAQARTLLRKDTDPSPKDALFYLPPSF